MPKDERLARPGRNGWRIERAERITGKRIHFRLDGAHPPAAAHHQEIVASTTG